MLNTSPKRFRWGLFSWWNSRSRNQKMKFSKLSFIPNFWDSIFKVSKLCFDKHNSRQKYVTIFKLVTHSQMSSCVPTTSSSLLQSKSSCLLKIRRHSSVIKRQKLNSGEIWDPLKSFGNVVPFQFDEKD